jgi:peptide/nickel transport system permease protein
VPRGGETEIAMKPSHRHDEPVEPAAEECESTTEVTWRRFQRHRFALWSLYTLLALYALAIFADLVTPYDPHEKHLDYAFAPPQLPTFSWSQQVQLDRLVPHLDPVTLRRTYTREGTVALRLFPKVTPYRLWGLIPMERRVWGPEAGGTCFVFGTDRYGRDILSRIVEGSRISLSIGLVSIVLTFLLGSLIGGVSGYMGGRVDEVVQRLIEIINAFPQLPLWLALGAALPADLSPLKSYFGITLVLALLGWTGLARVVRGKMLSLREEEFAVAARLIGASHSRIIFRHLLPVFASHLIVTLTLSVPGMILGETALSFLGLGLKPPTVSWGVMLQDCTNVQVVTFYPWLLLPVGTIIVTVLAFNFLGDGLRDAVDPYASR